MRVAKYLALIWASAVLASGAFGCGQEEGLGQDEPAGTYRVEIVHEQFPLTQGLGESVELVLSVRNAGEKTIPDLAITVDSFSLRSSQEGLADRSRPVWLVDRAPPGARVAMTGTYRFGKLPPGKSTSATWEVTAVKAGTHTLKYKIAAGLTGNAKARLADGQAAEGAFVVSIVSEPGS